jgi:prepilin peptidase CpaA
VTQVHLAAMAIATVACAWDLRTRRIPNLLTFSTAAAGFVYHGVTGGPMAVGDSVSGWLAGLLMFLVPFALGGIGGGDVKLMAALGAWVGPLDALWIGLYTGASGGVLAIVVAAFSGYLRKAIDNIGMLLMHWRVAGLQALPELTLRESTAPKLAYALPILCGTVMTIWLR